jgi:hypothetical protein
LQRTIGDQAVQRLLQANAEGLEVGSDTSTTNRFARDFSRIPMSSKSPVSLQTKLAVNTPGDIYEQEADRVSEQMMTMTEPQQQRYCACGGGCPTCQNEQADKEHSQSKPAHAHDSDEMAAPPIVQEVLRSTGQPLDPSTREFMESRFHHDFSQVRVHTDTRAGDAASAIGARAFTGNRAIVFGVGEYAPQTESGRKLLAHELTHVVQQQAISTVNPIGNAPIQRKLVDQAGREIKVSLEGVKPGDSVTPEFPEKTSSRVRKDTTRIVNAMLKTPSGLSALKNWINMPEPIRLRYTEKMLFGEQGEEAHGLSQPTKKGVTDVSVSAATLSDKSDRYQRLEGEQLWGAVAVHESVHQSKENLEITKRHEELLDEIDEGGDKINKKDPRLAQEAALAHEKEVGPVRLELTSLIEYDILYPDKAGNWRTRNFEKFLGKDIYRETVNKAIDGLVLGGYLDAAQKSQVLDLYLLHTKRPPKKR